MTFVLGYCDLRAMVFWSFGMLGLSLQSWICNNSCGTFLSGGERGTGALRADDAWWHKKQNPRRGRKGQDEKRNKTRSSRRDYATPEHVRCNNDMQVSYSVSFPTTQDSAYATAALHPRWSHGLGAVTLQGRVLQLAALFASWRKHCRMCRLCISQYEALFLVKAGDS